MIYKAKDSRISFFCDRYRTGNFGEEFEGGQLYCDVCENPIRHGNMYYFTNDNVYCMGCRSVAEEMILENVRHEFLYER